MMIAGHYGRRIQPIRAVLIDGITRVALGNEPVRCNGEVIGRIDYRDRFIGISWYHPLLWHSSKFARFRNCVDSNPGFTHDQCLSLPISWPGGGCLRVIYRTC